MNPEWFADRLRELRTAAGVSQKQLAAKAGMALSAIGHLEQGIRSPSWETVLALCAALGVSCETFTQEPQPTPTPERGRPRKTPAPETEAAADKPAKGKPKAKKRQK
jgi:transcriptional regulator with XRE-family HTH domain